MLNRLLTAWWGNFKKGDLQKFGMLSLIFFFVIGTYWLLRPLKDSLFMAVVGPNYIPMAKWLSVAIVFPLVLIYSKLLEYFPRHKMFYLLCTIYAVAALIFAVIMYNPTIGLANAELSPYRIWGWAWYVYIESFGSLIVALFWAFVTDITDAGSAADGFRLISFGGQLGNVVGPLILTKLMELAHAGVGAEGEIAPEAVHHEVRLLVGAVVGAAVAITAIMALVALFMRISPKAESQGFDKHAKGKHEEEPGFFEGLKILVGSPYLLAIFAVITFYEVIVTVFDFNFKVLAQAAFPTKSAVTAYLASYGMWTGILSLFCVFLGVNRIQKLIGVGASLTLLPILITVAIFTFKSYTILSVLFWIMVLAKAINYALTQPTMKQLYIPTSSDAKYKSQAFIEMYGSRGSKALGSAINNLRKIFIASRGPLEGAAFYIAISSYLSFGIVAVWLFVALYLGKTYKHAVEHNKIIC